MSAELDFVSQFPSIMSRFNISPETVNCRCCPDALAYRSWAIASARRDEVSTSRRGRTPDCQAHAIEKTSKKVSEPPIAARFKFAT